MYSIDYVGQPHGTLGVGLQKRQNFFFKRHKNSLLRINYNIKKQIKKQNFIIVFYKKIEYT